MMVFDVDRLKNEFTLIEKSNKEQIKGHEDRITKNKNLIYEMVNTNIVFFVIKYKLPFKLGKEAQNKL